MKDLHFYETSSFLWKIFIFMKNLHFYEKSSFLWKIFVWWESIFVFMSDIGSLSKIVVFIFVFMRIFIEYLSFNRSLRFYGSVGFLMKKFRFYRNAMASLSLKTLVLWKTLVSLEQWSIFVFLKKNLRFSQEESSFFSRRIFVFLKKNLRFSQ
jgi:hypothetical protein